VADTEAGERLRAAVNAARGRRTVKQVAEDAGVLRQTLYKWFEGGTPRLPELRAVARVLGVPLASLVEVWDGPSGSVVAKRTDDPSAATLERLEAEILRVSGKLDVLAEVLAAAPSRGGQAR
jgi:transcriptional regulator with XRE-family HTH domain